MKSTCHSLDVSHRSTVSPSAEMVGQAPTDSEVVRGAYNIDLNKVDSSFTKLHRACLLNDDAQVKKHLQKVDNNLHDSSHRYPIHLATVNGNFAILKLLIDNGANPNVQDNEGHTALIKSIECGHEHLVKFFLSNGADPDISDMDNNTALHWAIMTESIIAIDALLSSKKCDLSLRNNKDETCLHLAVRSPLINTQTFESMIRLGSDLNAKDQLGLTVVDIAQACNNKVAINAINRCSQFNTSNTLNSSTKTIESGKIEVSDTENLKSENHPTNDKICEDYKQRYLLKNKENLEYEKKVIQLASHIERLKLDMGHLKDQYAKLETNSNRLTVENSKLFQENKRLQEKLKQTRQKEDLKDRGQTCCCSKTKFDLATENLECRGHKEFLVARNLNQERINKLKTSLTT